jgi:hypothetical protein
MSTGSSEDRFARQIQVLLGALGLALILAGLLSLGYGRVHELLLEVFTPFAPGPEEVPPEFRLIRLGLDLMFRGFLVLVVFVWLTLRLGRAREPGQRRGGLLVPVAILALMAFWLPTILLGYSAVIGEERYWWLFEDMMITMRYGKNLADGAGLVWNPGEYVEGYTNFLWAIVMAGVHLLPIPLSKTALVVSLTNLGLAVLTIPLLVRVVAVLGGGSQSRVAAATAFVLSLNLKTWGTAGTESVLLAAMVLLAVLLILRDVERGVPALPPYLVLGAMSLVRSDALIIAALLYGTSLVLHRDRAKVLLMAIPFLLLPSLHLGFRLVYYGDLVPNTAHLKVLNWEGRFEHGLHYLLGFLRTYPLAVLLVLAAGLFRTRSTIRLLTGTVVIHAGYVAYVGGDVFPQFRFFAPVLPLAFILMFVGIERILPWPTPRVLASTLGLITIPLAVPGAHLPISSREVPIGNIEIALLLNENLSPQSSVADFWGGMPPYFSGLKGVDLLGKNDPYVARLPALHGAFPGHNKFDFEYSLGVLRPDVVVGTFVLPVEEEEMRRLAREIPWRGRLYFSETFREHCLGNPVPVSTWRTIFICDWSPALPMREDWEIPY